MASKLLNDLVLQLLGRTTPGGLSVSRYFTDEMGVATETLSTLRGVIANMTPDTDVSTVHTIVQIIGTVPPGGELLAAATGRA